ncbi:MAG: hypothetical protein DDT42_01530 [candidate division WS2 bacterium]|uniref:Proteasome subunit beta n=1 Tax=Psychracetigena formicireducens TaxID=2986056 RepID=A0A9E2BHG7_PSYF1|nr:hypothetical protein [Candidatus Psychracetigena formicireducens]
MTIILAFPVKDGLLIASDSQITSGIVRTTGKKIKKLNDQCLWSASGELALIQRVEEGLTALSTVNQPLSVLRDNLSKKIRECVVAFHTLVGGRPITGDFVFVEYTDKPNILHVTLDGTPEWIAGRPFVSGIGDVFTYALLRKYQGLFPDKIDMQKGSLLAFKVIEEVIDVVSVGVGPPIDIWQLMTNGIKNLNESEITALEDASHGLREAELKLLLG